jgi:GNAT superfamily N-acetyltransferase
MTPNPGSGPGDTSARCRRATAADAADLARLRVIMLSAERPVTDSTWKQAAAAWFCDQLLGNAGFAAFVVPGEQHLLSCAVGLLHHHPPRPGADPWRGLIVSVATDPLHRRRGHARSCVTAVRDWLVEQGAAAVALTPSPDSRALYLDLGFTDDRDPHMLWRPPPPPRR